MSIYKKFENIVGKTEDDTTKNLYSIFKFAVLITVTVLALNLILRIEYFNLSEWKLGEFGDFFGGVLNPILTFLMFLGLIITIVMQKTELALARKEFSKTASALKEQSVSSKQQVLENTFFNLLKIHNDTLESLRFNDEVLCCAINTENEKTSGRAVFSSILSWINIEERVENTLDNYMMFQETENHVVGHYFRGLYQILKFINDCELSEMEKEKYSRLLRAQLSSDELALLYFNCITPSVDSGQFRSLLIKFKILEHLRLGKEDFWERFTLSGRSVYTFKCDLVKYVEFNEDGSVQGSAFGNNPTAMKELHSHNNSSQGTQPSCAPA